MIRMMVQEETVLMIDIDVDLLELGWYLVRRGVNRLPRVARKLPRVNGKQKTIYLHREIMNPGPDEQVNFLNGNSLDCRRENLSIVLFGQLVNRFLGVAQVKDKWKAQIRFERKKKPLGIFDRAAVELYGAFARLNFPVT